MRIGWPAFALLLLVGGLSACEIDGTIGSDRDGGTVDGGGNSSQTSGEPTGGSGGGTADGGPGGSTDNAEGGGTGGELEGSGDGPSDLPPICRPTPDDSACSECRKQACCMIYDACLAHDSCLCWWECIIADHTPEECGMQCETDGVLYNELHACGVGHCDACS